MGRPKIIGLEEALEAVAPEDREAMREELQKLFEDFDPSDPPGITVLSLPQGTTACPKCGGALVRMHAGAEVAPGDVVDFFDCEGCEQPYAISAAS